MFSSMTNNADYQVRARNSQMAITADEYRARASAAFKEANDSFDRCDTDGYLSQWASDRNGDHNRRLAALADVSFMFDFEALFDLDGNLLDARRVTSHYGGIRWMITDADGERRFVSESMAASEATARRNNAKKGFYVGCIRAAAFYDRRDGIRRVESLPFDVLDNGLPRGDGKAFAAKEQAIDDKASILTERTIPLPSPRPPRARTFGGGSL